MQSRINIWEKASSSQQIFLRCYQMMTVNMLKAINANEFSDSVWVSTFLQHFAEYYFNALEAYEKDPYLAPPVWQMAHVSAQKSAITPLQNLLLGINAHINYDLVFTLVDLLKPEWHQISETQRENRYRDYSYINDIIAQTIDAVQDQVLEPAMPVMRVIDVLFGKYDELLISRMINEWRESVWQRTCGLLEAKNEQEKIELIQTIENKTLKMARMICLEE